MGQYFKVVNLDKKEYIDPHRAGSGAKLMEFALSSMGIMTGLAVLLADSNGRGGGDLHEDESPLPIAGRWAGDRISVTGDYGDEGRFITDEDVKDLKDKIGAPLPKEKINLYGLACETFTDITPEVLFGIMSDGYVCEDYLTNAKSFYGLEDVIKDFALIHKQDRTKDWALLVGQMKSEAGKDILARILKQVIPKVSKKKG